ncbi:MAG: toxin [Gemmatimonadales bacterium]|nr:toxin [Gemmatimonadales bacterium]
MQQPSNPQSRPAPSTTDGAAAPPLPSPLPSIAMPKGGGAIRGIGEKFAANPVTGTASITLPFAVSPGRAGSGPELLLTYDSGAGNGPFGFGWSLNLPQITRKTDKGLPQYHDADESDDYILSGAEDLVPLLDANGLRHADTAMAPGYTVCRYRPRVEGLFARIERWTRDADGDVHWRSFSKDNVLTLYGVDDDSRIADPVDTRRVFTWLISETRDGKGNGIVYGYKREDGVGADLSQVHQRNRGALDDPRRTTNRYLKRIRYGNREPLLDPATGRRPRRVTAQEIADARWMFEVVLDYGEHDSGAPMPADPGAWAHRADAFSAYRAGFEIRTARLCRRVLMFHHFAHEENVGDDCLVRSTDFTYSHEIDPADPRNPTYTFLRAVTHTGYRRKGAGYDKRSLPPVEYHYSQPTIQDAVHEVDPANLPNLPIGVDGTAYQWTDLHGEGIPGILTEQVDAWLYQRNISPIGAQPLEFAPVELVASKPNLVLAGGQAQLMDLAGDGDLDAVVLGGPMPGLYEHQGAEGWGPFRPFASRLNRDLHDPNLKFIDLDGNGRADLLISEDDAFVWHPSLGEAGFGSANRVAQALDEEEGPRLVFADGTESVYLADLSGDGLTDIARIRNGEVCYWPNLGYGRFGAKITMDDAPHFDRPDQFDQRRLRLADIDGTGTTDLIYLHQDGIRLYFNQSGNRWSAPRRLAASPRVDDVVSIVPVDLRGNGTTCLVWSSSLPADVERPMRYVDLMGGQKPHLLTKTVNNLGAETRVTYASSTKFYLQDKYAGRPWITRLPFPVQVVERVETFDAISRNRFVTRYAYHHGYFDGEEREFRGFGMVEQLDTEELAALTGNGALPPASNVDGASHVPPVLTKTWYHTGIALGRDHVSDFFAGLLDATDTGEYYREQGLTDLEARSLLLPDTALPGGLSPEEEREACRALKGGMLRQEVYARDGTPKAAHPYSVLEQTFAVAMVQPRGENRHAVFFAHPLEAITYHYERDLVVPADPRTQHALTLEVDPFGNVLKEATIGYGRRQPDATLPLPSDRDRQTRSLVTYTESRVSNSIDDTAALPDDYRAPVPCEATTYELTGYTPSGSSGRYQGADFVQAAGNGLTGIFDTEIPYEGQATNGRQRRLIEQVRTLYRPDDLGSGPNDPLALLSLGTVEPLALPGDSFKLAFTSGLITQVFQRGGQPLLPNPAAVLGGQGADRGGYQQSQQLKADGRFPATDPDDRWWTSAGRTLLSPDAAHTAAEELAYAQRHFFLPHRFRDPFHGNLVPTENAILYDTHDLLLLEARDTIGNQITAGERQPNGTLDPAKPGNDYRVLKPRRVMDPNRNRTEIAFDLLGMVVGTAVMGKPEENLGDSLAGFAPDLAESVLLAHLADPLADPHAILGRATMRAVPDFFAYYRTRHLPDPQPATTYTLTRETHDADVPIGETTRVQHSFSYSDGFAREIQKKMQAEPERINGVVGPPRWVGSGWTIFNNKGKPVRQYEPFFSPTHRFEFGMQVGVSPILFYDPADRTVATLHPNATYEKTLFSPWHQATWDVNDTVTDDPRTDPDVSGYTAAYFAALPPSPPAPTWQTWYVQRQGGARGPEEQAAAARASAHAHTPTLGHFDALGRPFLTIAHNKVVCPGHLRDGTDEKYHTRVDLDIEGNRRVVRDAILQGGDQQGRIVLRCAYDLLGNRLCQRSMEAGARWTLRDVAGRPIRAWDSRGHLIRTEYDSLRRPIRAFVTGADPANPNVELLTERLVYGEQHPNPSSMNLRGQLYLHLDQAGLVANEVYDFKGSPQRASRRLTGGTQYRQAVDWRAVDADHVALPPDAMAPLDPAALDAALAPRLEADAYASETIRDALKRPILLTTPHTPAMRASTIRPSYNEANLLDRVEANLRGALAGGQPVWTLFVANIDYNAKGQRLTADFGNLASTTYDYDPLTSRLTHLATRRNPIIFPGDCPQPPAANWPGCQVQNLYYFYDPVGNITGIRDDAQQTVYFRNKRVDPNAEYVYDALYRLIQATGREHLGQIGGAPIPHSSTDAPRVRVAWSANDGNAIGTYIERYVYDAVGNFQEMRHLGTDPAHPGWTRTYAYGESSLLEDGTGGTQLKTNNRLSSTTVGANNPPLEPYRYDAHGNMVRMPHLAGADPAPNMDWGYRDQLRATAVSGDGTAHHVYDGAGVRVRKVWERTAGTVEERIYFGGFEIFRRTQGAARLERETLHLMDDKQRIASVETRTLDTAGTDPAPSQLFRYQYDNHLGSASLELDEQARIVSYEEYTPYGSTSYQAVRSLTETPKRYRYTGKEREEESGLYYHGARHYAPWLARWTSADPALFNLFATEPDGSASGHLSLNPYEGMASNPITYVDLDGRQDTGYTRYLDRQFATAEGAHKTLEAHRQMGAAVLKVLAQPRVVGTIQTVGGGVELVGAGALLLTPEPTMATKVAGVALGAHGVDTFQTGLRTLWTGEVKQSVTHGAGAAVATAAGASPETAHWVGVGADILMSVGPATVGALSRTGVTVATETAAGAGVTEAALQSGDDAAGALFRGTSEGFPGSSGLQRVGVTPTSTDPLVATVFGTESQNYGKGVVQIATAADLEGVTLSQGNVLAALEKEVAVELLPLQFAERAGAQITAAEARGILERMGHVLPGQIRGPAGVSQVLGTTPRLTPDEIKLFVQEARLISAAR